MDKVFDKNRTDELLDLYHDDLFNDVLPFWLKHSIDHEDGGFTFCLDRKGNVIDTDKGVWQTGRFTWLLATLYNDIENKPEWLETAKHGVAFLEKYCFDSDGQMLFIVDKKGNPVRKRRYVFSESFAAIAWAAYSKAIGSAAYGDRAKELFKQFIKYNSTPGITPPKFTKHREMKSMGVPMIGIVTAQELRKNIGDDGYTPMIDGWINEIQEDFLNHEYKAVMETVGPKGEFINHFDGRTLNPGHAIEGSWFILNEAKYRNNDPDLIKLGTTMLDWMWEIGWDKTYGGILYFRDVLGLPVQEYWHDMKFWWPQNEGIIATLLAYQLTGNEKYAQWHKVIHEWTLSHFPDRTYGEWYGYLHRDGSISVDLKGNIWKGPFHIPRMYLICYQILKEIQQSSV